MKFYDRINVTKELNKLSSLSKNCAVMSVVAGAYNVGVTEAILNFAKDTKSLYLYISKKSEPLLCAQLLEEVKKSFEVPEEETLSSFKDIFSFLLKISEKENYSLIIDNFYELINLDQSIFEDLEKIWDEVKSNLKINLIFAGSAFFYENRVFENLDEPLFRRANKVIVVRQFSIPTIYSILADYDKADLKLLFDYYVLTGGIPKYIDILIHNSAFSLEDILTCFINKYSPILNEGKLLLVEELGRDYGTYFSILELMSDGISCRSKIKSILKRNVGGFFKRLEDDYAIISKFKPINAEDNSRVMKYKISDSFINFWFRFVNKNRVKIESMQFDQVLESVKEEYEEYSMIFLRDFFSELLFLKKDYQKIGSYWEKNDKNLIDIVAVNDDKKEILFAQVSFEDVELDMKKFKKKARRVLKSFPEYTPEYKNFCLSNAKNFLE